MEGFTIVDAGVLVIVLLSAILAYSRGFVRELFAILGWVAAAAAGFVFAPQVAPLVKQVPVIDGFLGDNCELSTIAGFFAVFAGTLIVVSIIMPLFASVVQRSALSGIDQGLGFLFGVARGLILVAVAFLVYNRMIAGDAVPVVDDSRSAQVFASVEQKLNDQVPTDAPGWVADRYNELVGQCGSAPVVIDGATAPAADAPAAAPAEPAAEGEGAATGDGTSGIGATGAKVVTP